jgi:hypothetical protein
MARPLWPSPGDHFTLRYEQKADPRRRNRRKEDGVSERCHRRSLNILIEVKKRRGLLAAPLFAHTVRLVAALQAVQIKNAAARLRRKAGGDDA